MREKHNIRSPDRSDTYCFMYLVNPEAPEEVACEDYDFEGWLDVNA